MHPSMRHYLLPSSPLPPRNSNPYPYPNAISNPHVPLLFLLLLLSNRPYQRRPCPQEEAAGQRIRAIAKSNRGKTRWPAGDHDRPSYTHRRPTHRLSVHDPRTRPLTHTLQRPKPHLLTRRYVPHLRYCRIWKRNFWRRVGSATTGPWI